MSTDSKKRTGDEEYRRSAVHRCLYAAGAFWYLSGGGWQAFDLSFTAGQKRTVKVEADLKPVQLADSAKDGPCYAFTVPIRLGRVWARPAGKLDATVTLGEDLKPEDVILVRPPEAKRDGRKITLSLDGQEPVEDLIVVVKGKLPESPKPPAKPPAEKPDAVPAPPGRPETF